MPPKSNKSNKSTKSAKSTKSERPSVTQSVAESTTTGNTYLASSDNSLFIPRCVSLSVHLTGAPPTQAEYLFIVLFHGAIIMEEKWENDAVYEAKPLPIDLKNPHDERIVCSKPLTLLMRTTGGKGSKESDPLCHPDNRAGATVDMFPLVLGEEEVFTKVYMYSIASGERFSDCTVQVRVLSPGSRDDDLIPLTITMLSIHCLPQARDNTVYMSAIGLNGLQKPKVVNFLKSLSNADAKKVVWASEVTAGHITDTTINIIHDDKFIPSDLNPQTGPNCRSFYWNAMKRVMVDPEQLRERLSSPFFIDVAGVPRIGKVEVRGRYMGFVDARVLLEPGQRTVTVCSKLTYFIEANIPDHVGPLLDIPPTSAKPSTRDTDQVLDEHGHNAYVITRFDLTEPLVFKLKIEELYSTIGFPLPQDSTAPRTEANTSITPDEITIDARQIRVEAGALAVHKELSGLACKGVVPMTQGIRRTAANRLLLRVRAMLKSFPPGDCSYIDWQDTVTGQHAASRRAVTASFAPQPPKPRIPEKVAASRSRIAGDIRVAEELVKTNLETAGCNPRLFLALTLRSLEERHDMQARSYLLEALSIETRNRFLLWILGALEFDQSADLAAVGGAAFRIAVKGDSSDGTANAIGWAALHAFHHYHGNQYAAFVAAKKMRKSFSLPREWDKIIDRWVDTSGEEEIFWSPTVIESNNPMLIAAAFFLCLKCFKFTERLLRCVEQGCAKRGCFISNFKTGPDIFYIRAASLILRNQFEKALEMTLEGIKRYGPSPIMSQMRVTCLTCMRNWDSECHRAMVESEKAGSKLCPSLLYKSALSMFKVNPNEALQRAARAHKQAPSAYTALLIGRIQARLGEDWLAERWLAAAVKLEPLLADGWAMLCLLAMYNRNLPKARAMLRSARQAGPISPDIESEMLRVMDMVKLDRLPDFLVKNLCLCDYF